MRSASTGSMPPTRPLLAGETFREWLTAPSWDTSRAFLHDHPELLDEETPGLLASLTKDPDPAITVHHALLTLARTLWTMTAPTGAWKTCSHSRPWPARHSRPGTPADSGPCADIETVVHGRALAGELHRSRPGCWPGLAGRFRRAGPASSAP